MHILCTGNIISYLSWLDKLEQAMYHPLLEETECYSIRRLQNVCIVGILCIVGSVKQITNQETR